MRPPRLLPVIAAGALVLAACGDDDTSQTADTAAIQTEPAGDTAGEPAADAPPAETDAPAVDEPAVDQPTIDAPAADAGSADDAGSDGGAIEAEDDTAAEPPADEPAAPALRSTRLDDGRIDLLGPDVDAAADVESNLLPDVVVDDLQTGAKVNFRNIAPQSVPILLWMYAPH